MISSNSFMLVFSIFARQNAKSWEAFAFRLSQSAHLEVMWNKLWCMSGKYNRACMPCIPLVLPLLHFRRALSIFLPHLFLSLCIWDNYLCLRMLEDAAKRLPWKFSSQIPKGYNWAFCMDTSLTVLEQWDYMSHGCDGIHKTKCFMTCYRQEFLLSMFDWLERSSICLSSETVKTAFLRVVTDYSVLLIVWDSGMCGKPLSCLDSWE